MGYTHRYPAHADTATALGPPQHLCIPVLRSFRCSPLACLRRHPPLNDTLSTASSPPTTPTILIYHYPPSIFLSANYTPMRQLYYYPQSILLSVNDTTSRYYYPPTILLYHAPSGATSPPTMRCRQRERTLTLSPVPLTAPLTTDCTPDCTCTTRPFTNTSGARSHPTISSQLYYYTNIPRCRRRESTLARSQNKNLPPALSGASSPLTTSTVLLHYYPPSFLLSAKNTTIRQRYYNTTPSPSQERACRKLFDAVRVAQATRRRHALSSRAGGAEEDAQRDRVRSRRRENF